jgi:hypothetical protein
MSFGNLQWLFPIVVTLHNAEEAIWLPGWSKRAVLWHSPVAPGSFRFSVAVLTVLAFVITWLSAELGKQTVWAYLVFGCMVVTLANVLIPHVALSVALRSYMPGVATAVTLNLPVLSLLVVMALKEGLCLRREGSGIFRWCGRSPTTLYPSALQIGKGPEPLSAANSHLRV